MLPWWFKYHNWCCLGDAISQNCEQFGVKFSTKESIIFPWFAWQLHSSNTQYTLSHCQNCFAFCRNWVLPSDNYKLNFYVCGFLSRHAQWQNSREFLLETAVQCSLPSILASLTKPILLTLSHQDNHNRPLQIAKVVSPPLPPGGTAFIQDTDLVLFSMNLCACPSRMRVFTSEGRY